LHIIEEKDFPAHYGTTVSSISDRLPRIKKLCEDAMQQVCDEAKGPAVTMDIHVVEGNAASAIVEFSETRGIDLVVIATHGLTGIKHLLLGSVTEKVVRMAQHPVFTVKMFGKSLV
jgi:nucleotide-binding universal stress UspA family protein